MRVAGDDASSGAPVGSSGATAATTAPDDTDGEGGIEDTYVYDVAVDAEGNHLAVGTQWNEARAQVPWIGSWTPDGTRLWSIQETTSGAYSSIDVDASRIVVGGTTEQVDSSRGRLLVAEYELDGSPRWSQKLTAFQAAMDVVAVGEETVVLAAGLGADGMRTLLRYDADGERRWSVDAWGQGDAAHPPDELVPDGDGGTWIHGKLRERPVAVRFDSEGREIERLDCIGDATGWAMKLAVDSRGRVAIGVLVDSASPRSDAWVVLVEGGRSVAGYRLDPALEASLRFTALAWRSDDALVVAADEYYPDFAHLSVLDATVGF